MPEQEAPTKAEQKAPSKAPLKAKLDSAAKAKAPRKSAKKAAKKATKKATKKPAKKTTKKATKKTKKATKKATKSSKKVRTPTAQDVLKQLRTTTKDKSDFTLFGDPLAHIAPVTEWIPTGILGIDGMTAALDHQGGWPEGRVIEIASAENVGKSTLLDQSIAQHQRAGGIACLLDTERARDTKYMQALGVDLDNLIIADGDSIEDAFHVIESMLQVQEENTKLLARSKRRSPPMLIVWDSVGGTATIAEQEASSADVQVASAAKVIRRNMRRLVSRLPAARTTLLLANQLYQGIGAFSPTRSYGGGGIRYAASLRYWLYRGDSIKKGNTVVGHEIKVTMKKTRVCSPRAAIKLGLIYGAGVHNAWSLFDWGKKTAPVGVGKLENWIVKSGNLFALVDPADPSNPIKFHSQSLGLADLLAKRPDLYQTMASQYVYGGLS